ncbi:hypothetical protein C2G38_2147815 [Gigaspora rosea]|uniref:TLDc domain-containing protein n=1 Tax=Gigaspora rosea TaxID=44941 RepID=A0A397UDQ7_9GLOM|nr:hypothetical protein C2G38_2147815 [Gigaspora rosea]
MEKGDDNSVVHIIKKLLFPNKPISSVILPSRVILTKITPRTTEPFSTIINEAHVAEISSWIDKKDNSYTAANNPYDFKLLLRGTRDGFTSTSFWNLCDKQTNVVLVANVKGTGEILGGYNPNGWK